jgi:Cdc6-like AAA superfamily ATPase
MNQIIKARLAPLSKFYPNDPIPLIHPMAIELIARKISSTGDLRKALDIIRSVTITYVSVLLY